MIRRNPDKGLFITFEGVEGTGKSTHVLALRDTLVREGYAVTSSREPGGTPLAEAVRDLVLRSQNPGPEAELFLMLASRADHVSRLLIPRLNEGHVVLCDRFSHATLAYQGGGRGLNMDAVKGANQVATGGLVPDLTLLLDAPTPELQMRLKRRAKRKSLDRIDQEAEAFFMRVRNAYFELAQEDNRVVVITTEDDHPVVARSIWDAVRPALAARKEQGALA